MPQTDPEMDAILDITRCAECGQRLDGEIECPSCAALRGYDEPRPLRPRLPLWVLITALFLTFPLSLPWLVMSRHLSPWQKGALVIAFVLIFASLGAWFM